MARSHAFEKALVLSCLLHLGAFAALDQELISERLLAPPAVTARKLEKPKPQIVHFELVDTPESARAPEPPEKTYLMSDKHTRAQDRFESEKSLKNAPHMEGKNEDSKDTRPKMITPQPPARQPQPQPPKETKKRPELKEQNEPLQLKKEAAAESPNEPEPTVAPDQTEPAPDLPKKEVVRLAKKPEAALAPQPPATAPSFPSISASSSRDMDADAEIVGELSVAASRHFFGEYLLGMKEAVERQWVSRLMTRYTGIVASEAVIDFKIQPDGRVSDLSINSSEGDPYFPLVCTSSINDAQPFGDIPYRQAYGLPEEFMNKPLNIRFTFRYN